MTPEQRAREFVETGFRSLGVPSLEPYIEIIAELIEGAEQELYAANIVLATALVLARAEISTTRGAAAELIDLADENGWDEKLAERRVAELDLIIGKIDEGLELAKSFSVPRADGETANSPAKETP